MSYSLAKHRLSKAISSSNTSSRRSPRYDRAASMCRRRSTSSSCTRWPRILRNGSNPRVRWFLLPAPPACCSPDRTPSRTGNILPSWRARMPHPTSVRASSIPRRTQRDATVPSMSPCGKRHAGWIPSGRSLGTHASIPPPGPRPRCRADEIRRAVCRRGSNFGGRCAPDSPSA